MAVLAHHTTGADEPAPGRGGTPRLHAGVVLDAALAACIAAWGLGAMRAGTAVSYGIAALHFTVALLVLFRAPEQGRAPLGGLLMSLPAVAVGAIVLQLAPHPSTWALPVQAAFLLSVAAAVGSLITLGRSFAILPSRRTLVTHRAYRVVRHPIYAAELLMVCVAAGTLALGWGLLLALGAVCAVVVRIGVEERLWACRPEYAEYKKTVRWKLLPWVW